MGHLNSPAVVVYSRLLSVGLSVATIILLARALGPEGRGIVAALFASATILPALLGGGLPLTARRWAAEGHYAVASGNAIRVILITSPASVVVSLGVSYWFRAVLDSGEFFFAMVLLALTPIGVLGRVFKELTVASESYFRHAVVLVSQAFGMAGATVGLYAYDLLTVSGAIVAQIAGLVTFWIAGAALARPSLKTRDVRAFANNSRAFWLRDSLKELRDRVDQIVALPLLGAGPAGIYSIALAISTLPSFVGYAVGLKAFHTFRHLPPDAIASEFMAYARIAFTSTLLTAIFALAFLPRAVAIVFDSRFAGVVPLAAVMLVFFSPLLGLHEFGVSVFTSLDRGSVLVASEGLALGLGTGIAIPLGIMFGPMGMAVGFSLGLVIGFLAMPVALGVSGREVIPRKSDVSRLRTIVRSSRMEAQ